jgi:hypothetical protein
MVILYIYTTCWHMKSVFYECQQWCILIAMATSSWSSTMLELMVAVLSS